MAEEKKQEKTVETPAAVGAPQARPAAAKKKNWKLSSFGRVYIQSSFNNTLVTITDEKGDTVTWAAAGGMGFRGTKKGTPFAAQMTASKAARKAAELGIRQVAVFVKGPGPGRETAIRAVQAAGIAVVSLKDVSPLPHNGCRPPKARRV